MSRAKKAIADTFSRAYAEASPEEQAALRVWMGNIIRPQKAPRVDIAKARRFEKNPIEARDRRRALLRSPQPLEQFREFVAGAMLMFF